MLGSSSRKLTPLAIKITSNKIPETSKTISSVQRDDAEPNTMKRTKRIKSATDLALPRTLTKPSHTSNPT